jgi:lipopolysaccharide biosynthesis glycosyltransferase
MIASMVKNLKSYKNVRMYILENQISAQSKEKIEKNLDPERIEIIWIKIDPSKFRDMKILDHVTAEVYFKLLIPEILSQQIEKAIYLDCDLIVNEDIGKLWDIEIGDSYLLAAPEMHRCSLYASSPNGIKLYKDSDLPPKKWTQRRVDGSINTGS